MSHFAIVTRDELWSLDRHAVLESRLIHGTADHDGEGMILARDDCDGRLREQCDAETARVHAALNGLTEGRARSVVAARSDEPLLATISITLLDLSIVTTLAHLRTDYESLVELASIRPETSMDYRGVPVAWRNGSGAVLLHEAAGHPSEDGRPPVTWPRWLRAFDRKADLLAGVAPAASRRQSFTDVPMPRMTEVVVEAGEAGDLPPRRIDILLVAGGRYEPLTDTVSLSVSAADFIDGERSTRLTPFVINESRRAIADAMRGAAGETRRYPGVICTKEGQQVFVGSHAPDLVMEL